MARTINEHANSVVGVPVFGVCASQFFLAPRALLRQDRASGAVRTSMIAHRRGWGTSRRIPQVPPASPILVSRPVTRKVANGTLCHSAKEPSPTDSGLDRLWSTLQHKVLLSR